MIDCQLQYHYFQNLTASHGLTRQGPRNLTTCTHPCHRAPDLVYPPRMARMARAVLLLESHTHHFSLPHQTPRLCPVSEMSQANTATIAPVCDTAVPARDKQVSVTLCRISCWVCLGIRDVTRQFRWDSVGDRSYSIQWAGRGTRHRPQRRQHQPTSGYTRARTIL